MSFFGTVRSLGEAFGVWKRGAVPAACSLGRVVYRETKRSAMIANVTRPRKQLQPVTMTMLSGLFPELEVGRIRVRNRCRLPSNRFKQSGSIYAMTFGYTIYWRDVLNERKADDLVKLIHEVVHVDQVRRFGGENAFACEYGKGYMAGGGEVPSYMRSPSAYHLNPLEAEAYSFESQFRNAAGKVDRNPLTA